MAGKAEFYAQLKRARGKKLYVIRSSICELLQTCRICGACKYLVTVQYMFLYFEFTFMISREDKKVEQWVLIFQGGPGAVQSNLILLRSTTAAVSSDPKLPVSSGHEPACTVTSVYDVQMTQVRCIQAW